MDETALCGIFWHHLVYPELASDGLGNPAVLQEWIARRLPHGRWPDCVVCIAVDGLDVIGAAERRDAVEQISALVASALAPAQRALLGFAHTNAVYFCALNDLPREALAAQLAGLNDRIAAGLGLPSTVGVAFLPHHTLEGFQWAAQHAIVAQRQKVRTGPNRVYLYDETAPPTTVDMGEYWSLAQRLHTVIRRGNAAETRPVVDDVVHALFQGTYLSLNHLRPLLQSQVIFMAQAATAVMADSDAVARLSESSLTQIATAFDYARLRELLTEAAFAFTELVHEHYSSVSNRLTAAVDEFVAAHLPEPDLGLSRIAAHVGVSPAHISRTYKMVTGTGIARSINMRRVEHAKRLLLNRGLSITSVAFDAGFASVQHFGRMFRELTGTTPTAYRNARIT